MLAEDIEAEAAHLREGWAMEMTAQRLERIAAGVRELEAREQARLSELVPGESRVTYESRLGPEYGAGGGKAYSTSPSGYGRLVSVQRYGGGSGRQLDDPPHIAGPECEEPR